MTWNGKPLWDHSREQNSRLQQLIDALTHLLARSRDVLRGQRPEDRDQGKSS